MSKESLSFSKWLSNVANHSLFQLMKPGNHKHLRARRLLGQVM
jgi:hypothetical protein